LLPGAFPPHEVAETMPAMSSSALGCLLALALVAGTSTGGLAATSPWSEATGAKLRLIAPGGPPAADGTLSMGVEIALEPGWKTYWRHPGDAGLPPEIDFSGSTNLVGATIDFPAPRRFVDGGSTSIGYGGSVVLPVHLKPEDPALPVMVDARILYGACKELCVPASATARLMVSQATRADPAAAALLAAATATVPTAPTDDLDVTAVAPTDDPHVLLVTATVAAGAGEVDLFAEGPGEAFPRLPVRLDTTDPTHPQWQVRLDPHGPATGRVRFTLVAGDRAVERVVAVP
jgi:DsbC/DsbD-like thiol-disulfide interchange protein